MSSLSVRITLQHSVADIKTKSFTLDQRLIVIIRGSAHKIRAVVCTIRWLWIYNYEIMQHCRFYDGSHIHRLTPSYIYDFILVKLELG